MPRRSEYTKRKPSTDEYQRPLTVSVTVSGSLAEFVRKQVTIDKVAPYHSTLFVMSMESLYAQDLERKQLIVDLRRRARAVSMLHLLDELESTVAWGRLKELQQLISANERISQLELENERLRMQQDTHDAIPTAKAQRPRRDAA